MHSLGYCILIKIKADTGLAALSRDINDRTDIQALKVKLNDLCEKATKEDH